MQFFLRKGFKTQELSKLPIQSVENIENIKQERFKRKRAERGDGAEKKETMG